MKNMEIANMANADGNLEKRKERVITDRGVRYKGLVQGTIIENKKIHNGILCMKIACPVSEYDYSSTLPGQFVNVYLNDRTKLLPRPISVAGVFDNGVKLIFRISGDGTQQLAEYEPGETINISTPLGKGYPMEPSYEGRRAVLCGGGIGIPALMMLGAELKKRGAEIVSVLGYRDRAFLREEFERFGAVCAVSESGSDGMFRGNVVDYFEKSSDVYFACGPRAMLQAVHELCSAAGKPLWVSMEERMGCGFGACVGCSIKVMEDGSVVQRKVCKDGPVFRSEVIVW